MTGASEILRRIAAECRRFPGDWQPGGGKDRVEDPVDAAHASVIATLRAVERQPGR